MSGSDNFPFIQVIFLCGSQDVKERYLYDDSTFEMPPFVMMVRFDSNKKRDQPKISDKRRSYHFCYPHSFRKCYRSQYFK